MIIWTSQPNPTHCAYPFNASSAEVISLGVAGLYDTITESEQKGEFSYVAGTGRSPAMSVSGLGASPAIIDFSTGAKSFLIRYNVSGLTGGGSSTIINQVNLYVAAGGAPACAFRVKAEAAGGFTHSVFINNVSVYSVSSATGVVDIVPRIEAGTLRVWIAGSEVALSSNALPSSADLWPFAFSTHGSAIAPGDAGKKASIHIITNAADIPGTFPMGTTDICGTAI